MNRDSAHSGSTTRAGHDRARGAGALLVGAAVAAAALLAQAGGPTPGPAGPGAEWTVPAGTLEATRYSPLDQITSDNVEGLREIWRDATGLRAGHEGQPLVIGNRMYVVTPFPNKLIAYDLTRPGPARLWEFTPRQDTAAFGKACCDRVNRGAAHADGRIVYNLLDNHTVAVDAETGREVWRTRLGSVDSGETMTMAPLVVGTRVFVGNSGGELGVRGWLAALDVRTGRELWRAYSTGPDSAVRIGPDFRPHYRWMRGADLGVTSWPAQEWRRGGGTVWGWLSYDPELDLVYYGTANPGVWNPDQREGDNLWSTTIFARDPETGSARWAYQMSPHDAWDFDGVNENILVELPIAGRARRVLVHFDRNGFAYTIDRATGEVLVAQPFQSINWATRVDLESGRPVEVPEKRPSQGEVVRNICPSAIGARDQQPAAFSPRTGLFYSPAVNLCMDYGAFPAEHIPGTPYLGAAVKMYPGPGGNRGSFFAWDAVEGRKVWEITEEFPVWSGALATAGDVVFYGTMDGWFKAVDAREGRVLWRTRFDSGVVGNPISYLGPDGRQYVAVYSGVGGWAGSVVPGHLSPDDPYAALGAMNAMRDLPTETHPGGMVHVFALE